MLCADIVLSYHLHFELTAYHQSILTAFYASALSKMVTQQQMVGLISTAITQNVKLGFNLDIAVWNWFFWYFYKSRHQYQDRFICKLFGMMQAEGSNAKPDIETFNIILSGIFFLFCNAFISIFCIFPIFQVFQQTKASNIH